MERPEVRIIQDQQSEIKEVPMLDWEVQQLMQKYNIQQPVISQPSVQENPNNDLTFEQMVQLEEQRLKREEEIIRQRHQQQPNPNHKVDYITDDDTGFNYRVEVRMEGMEPPRY